MQPKGGRRKTDRALDIDAGVLNRALLTSSPDCIVVIDEQGTILEWNPEAERTFGFARSWVVGRPLFELVLGTAHKHAHTAMLRAFMDLDADKDARPVEITGVSADGTEFPVDCLIARVQPSEPPRFLAFFRDITDRKDSEAAIKGSEETFRRVFKDGPVGIALISPDHTFITVNQTLTQMLGYTEDEFENLTIQELTHPDDTSVDEVQLASLFDGDLPSYRVEKRLVAKDGRVIWVNFTSSLVRDTDGRPLYSLGVVEDISDRRRAEDELLRSLEMLRKTDEHREALLHRLVDAQEQERRRIASDIHDDSIQIMSVVALRLEMLSRSIERPEQLAQISKLTEAVKMSIGRLRNLIFELTPTILDHAGISAALRAKLDDMREESGLDFSLVNTLELEPPEKTRVIIYRIMQEVLANVRKHSQATRVEVSLEAMEDGIFVRIADNGKGFRPESVTNRQGHMGLGSINERAHVAGGWSRLISAPGRGTTVEFWVPNGRQDDLKIKVNSQKTPRDTTT